MVFIVGIGPGAKEYILPKADQIIKSCDVVIGFERAILSLEHIQHHKLTFKSLTEILNFIACNTEKNIAIAASGDPGFYGIEDYIHKNYCGKVEVIPGLSSFQYMMCKLNKSWQGAYLGSLHGREQDFIKIIRTHEISIWFTDKIHSPTYIYSELIKAKIGAEIFIGENLSYANEKIIHGNTMNRMRIECSALSVVVIQTNEWELDRGLDCKMEVVP